ncbi:MAG: recombinase family protein [Planctomycetaceae bacterium]|nr:recombinase family protein [Planctomycetaceae bacterium]
MSLNPPLKARHGQTLKVILVGRVSDPRPGKQNRDQSLGDQQSLQHRWLAQHAGMPLDITVVAGSGSGELLDREEYVELQRLTNTGRFDLVLTEDLGRIARRVDAYQFCELCEDRGTRLIAINNHNVDTETPGWRDAAFFNAYFYEKHNRDKSENLKGRLRSRFQAGGALERPLYGYVDPAEGAKHDSERQKDPEAEPIYDEWFRQLEAGRSFAEVADWLNAQRIPTGPYCHCDQWTGTLVGQYTRNQILKGLRRRNERKTRRVNATGKYVSRKADPEELLTRDCPHLAFIEPQRYDRVIRQLSGKNGHYRRKGRDSQDTRQHVSRKRTRFPGQMIECGVCGHGYVFGGHGQTDHLMCDGARKHRCWNGVTADGPLAAAKITDAVLQAIEQLPGFDEAFLESVNAEANRLDADDEKERRNLERQIRKLNRELDNFIKYVGAGRESRRVDAEIARLEEELQMQEGMLDELNAKPRSVIDIPPIDELKSHARAAISEVVSDGYELKRAMESLTPKIVVFPHWLCDGGRVVLRASFRLQAAGLVENQRVREALKCPLEQVLHVNLFDPPEREAFREQVVRMRQGDARGNGMTEYQVARELGITVTAAQRASALQRKMDRLGLLDPYLRITEPPEDCTKLRRHRHPRYRFQPLEHAGQF